jgi:hypothetical protein
MSNQPDQPKKPFVKPGSLDNARAQASQKANQFSEHRQDNHTRSILKRLRNRKSDLK